MVGCHANSIHVQHLVFDLYLTATVHVMSFSWNITAIQLYVLLRTLPNTLLILLILSTQWIHNALDLDYPLFDL